MLSQLIKHELLIYRVTQNAGCEIFEKSASGAFLGKSRISMVNPKCGVAIKP
jgi:hexokinase